MRNLIIAAIAALLFAADTDAAVVVRAPFTRVFVGGGAGPGFRSFGTFGGYYGTGFRSFGYGAFPAFGYAAPAIAYTAPAATAAYVAPAAADPVAAAAYAAPTATYYAAPLTYLAAPAPAYGVPLYYGSPYIGTFYNRFFFDNRFGYGFGFRGRFR